MTPSIRTPIASNWETASPSGLLNPDEGKYHLYGNIQSSISDQETSVESLTGIKKKKFSYSEMEDRLNFLLCYWSLKSIFKNIDQGIDIIPGLPQFAIGAECPASLPDDFLYHLQNIVTRGDEKKFFQSWSKAYWESKQRSEISRWFTGGRKDMDVWTNLFKNPADDVVGKVYPSPLQDALKDLDEAQEEAREKQYPEPSETAIRNARHLLPKMYQIAPQRFEVYPTSEGEIIIDAPGGYGRSVLLVCTPDGGALCLVNVSGAGDRQARYHTTDTLPDGFLREALEDMKQEDV